jgi:glycosyltransferase 2 family protein
LRRPREFSVPLWARALVSLALIGVVVSQLNLRVALRRVEDGQWQWFALAAASLLAALVVGAVRWHVFLEAAGIARGLSHTVRVYAIGAFANSFLPTAFGGDALRVWLAGSPGTRARAAVTVVVDRATMLASVIAFAWISLAVGAGGVPMSLVQTLAIVTALVIAGGLVAAAAIRASARRDSWLPSRVGSWIAKAASSTRACFRGPVAWQTTLLGLVYEGLAVAALWLVARSLEIDISFSVLAVVVPVVLVLTAVPLSLGGLGVREGSYVLLLHQAGVSTTDAALLSVSSTVLFALVTLPGAFALLATGRAHDMTGDAAMARSGHSTELTVP